MSRGRHIPWTRENGSAEARESLLWSDQLVPIERTVQCVALIGTATPVQPFAVHPL